jgi:hypothetical protein
MAFPLIYISNEAMFDSALAADYDAYVMDTMDTMTIEELIDLGDTQIFAPEGISITHDISCRSGCEFVVVDDGCLLEFKRGQTIIITDIDYNIEFAGTISGSETAKIPGGSSMFFHSIEGGDYWTILQRRVAVYSDTSVYAGDAVRAIWATYLVAEDIGLGYVEDGELLSEVMINYRPISEAFLKLAGECDQFLCYVGYDKKLYFHRRSYYTAAWNLTTITDIQEGSAVITRSNENYRNREIILGGSEKTDLQTEPLTGDGKVKSWALGYPVSSVDSITVQVGGVGDKVAQTVGIKGVDDGYDFYYGYDSETLTADTAPGNGDIIEVKYYGTFPIVTQTEDGSAILSYQALEGEGTGIVEHVVEDKSLKSLAAAAELGNSKLAEFARDGAVLQYATRRGDGEELAAGTVQTVSVLGLDDDFLITQVTKTFGEGNLITWAVQAVDGAMTEAWDAFFAKAIMGIGAVREGLNDQGTITVTKDFTHTFYDVDRPCPYLTAYPAADMFASDDTWPCFDPTERFQHIVLYMGGVEAFRKQHTQVLAEEANNSMSITLIGPSEGNCQVSHVGFFGGNSCSTTPESGVLLWTKEVYAHLKTVLESLQISCTYINGDA